MVWSATTVELSDVATTLELWYIQRIYPFGMVACIYVMISTCFGYAKYNWHSITMVQNSLYDQAIWPSKLNCLDNSIAWQCRDDILDIHPSIARVYFSYWSCARHFVKRFCRLIG